MSANDALLPVPTGATVAVGSLLDQCHTLLTLTAPAAEAAATHSIFADYQQRRRASTLDRQRQNLLLFAHFSATAALAGGLSVGDREAFAHLLYTQPSAWFPVTWGHVRAFVQWLLQQGYAISSINHALSTIKVYVGLTAQAAAMPLDEAQRIALIRAYSVSQGRNLDATRAQTRKSTKKATPVLITDERAVLLKTWHPDTPQGWRDATLMALLLDHGLRCSEIALLTMEGMRVGGEQQTTFFTFARPKVDLVQTHVVTEDVFRVLPRYLQERRQLDPPDRGPLLCSSWKNQQLIMVGMSARAINKRVRVLGEQVGIRGLSPHDCRHYWATCAVRGKTDIKSLQDAGGWASPYMPLRYAQSAAIANQDVLLKKQPL